MEADQRSTCIPGQGMCGWIEAFAHRWSSVGRRSAIVERVSLQTGDWRLATDKRLETSDLFLKELISQGWQALMRHRMRSVLTMLGIVWGLASVVILLAYGQGLGGSVLHAFMNMGNGVIVLWPGQTSLQAGGQRAGKPVTYQYE